MDAATTPPRMTFDEFAALPPMWTGTPRQLIDGEVVLKELSWAHSRAQSEVSLALGRWELGAAGRGGTGVLITVLLDERNVYIPSIVWYRDGRVPQITDLDPYEPPDLAVEVRSSAWRFDIGVKKSLYERRGVAELWLVDTAADVVLVFRRSKPDSPQFDVSEELDTTATLTSPMLPGFLLPVGEIFGD